jgi:hypothetical protein
MKFRYKKYGHILRPVIPIKVTNGNRTIEYEVLVDSGADICFFDAGIGDLLDLDITKGKPNTVRGVGGKTSVYYSHPVTIEVGGWPHNIEAGFMPDVAGNIIPYGIVGQKGFFEKFVVKFDMLKEEIELKPRT